MDAVEAARPLEDRPSTLLEDLHRRPLVVAVASQDNTAVRTVPVVPVVDRVVALHTAHQAAVHDPVC